MKKIMDRFRLDVLPVAAGMAMTGYRTGKKHHGWANLTKMIDSNRLQARGKSGNDSRWHYGPQTWELYQHDVREMEKGA